MNFKRKKILVCGMARSGISAAKLLKSLGADVILQDIKDKENFPEAYDLEAMGIKILSGENPNGIIKDMELVIVSPGIPSDLPFFKIARDCNIPLISELQLGADIAKCPIAAITGTNGKTTTTALTEEILRKKFPGAKSAGNIGIPFCDIANKLKEGDYVVLEVSSFQLETAENIKPKISAVLNITPDHLNRHKTMGNYISIKSRIFKNQTRDDFCILNYDDEVCRDMSKETKARVMFFSSEKALNEGIYEENGNIILKWEGICEKIIPISKLKILGKHNLENAMGASAIGFCAGVPLDLISKALEEFKGVSHRIEFIANISGVDYYNDSKGTNPDAAIKAVLAMSKPIILIGGGYDKKSEYGDWVKTFFGRVKELILIGETADKIEEEAKKQGFCAINRAENLKDAVILSSKLAGSGDCVLLSPACASWDMFKNYEERGDIFRKEVLGLKQ